MKTNDQSVPPLPLWGSALLFGLPTLLMWAATRYAVPLLRERLEGPDILCWFVAGGSVFFCLFAAAFAAIRLEGGGTSLKAFARRFRLRALSRADVFWSIGMLVICGLLAGMISAAWTYAAGLFTFLEAPELSPPFMEVEPLTRETLWVLAAWLPLFFFNIAGEELWWRGYMLPRQEQSHGKAAWILHGIGLAVFHLPLGIPLTIIALPVLFGLPLVVQWRRNLWTGFIVHGIFNMGGFMAVAFGLA